MTTEKRDPVSIDQLSEAAVFALTMIQAHDPRYTNIQRFNGFHDMFRIVFGVHFDEAPKSLWKDLYERGKKELMDHGLMDVEKDGEGTWQMKALREDLILPSKRSRH